MKTTALISIAAILVVGCGGSSARTSSSSEERASAGGSRGEAPPSPADATRVRGTVQPPALSDEMVASDSENPALTVSTADGWVVIPSFRLGVAMPDGWYWSNAEEMLRATETTRHHFDDTSIAHLRRGLQAVVNEYRQDDASMAGHLIPSARVLLLPGGLPRGARVGAEFCTQSVLPELAAVYPDAAIVSQEALAVAGYPSVRCGVDHSVEMVGGVTLPGHSETVLVFGESHVVMMAVVGGAERASRTADVLNAMVASVQPL